MNSEDDIRELPEKLDGRKYDPRLRWGKSLIDEGFCIIPDRVVKNWWTTELNGIDLAIIMNLAVYWWSPERLPHPSTLTLAKNLRVSRRTIERRLKVMIDRGFLSRGSKVQTENGPVTREYDLSGLIKAFDR